MAAYELPDLPYDYGALAPHISGEIMELHHSKHHATYVKGVNTALESWRRRARTIRSAAPAGEEPRLQPRADTSTTRCSGPTCPLRAATSRTATLARDRRVLRQLRQVPRPLRGERQRHPGLGLVDAGLGHSRPPAEHRAAFRPAGQPPAGADPDLAAGHVGARVLLAVQERQGRLRHRMVERRQLGGCSSSIRCSNGPDRWADRASVINF